MTHVLRGRNVRELLPLGLHYLEEVGERGNSRVGEVITAPHPVTSVYERPTERVLLSSLRDANPFFHLYESLWMLAGRSDADVLIDYVKRFADFADDGVVHGAYGHRWRDHMGYDQLDVIVEKLRANPDDRQCVLQMWDASAHTESTPGHDGSDDLRGNWRDRPCNTHVYFRVRKQRAPQVESAPFFSSLSAPVLDMAILCRSNDIIMGAYGANAVHFSMLMEYVAGRVGVAVGTMYQFSNNWHAYVRDLDKLGDPRHLSEEMINESRELRPMPIGEDWDVWDKDLAAFMGWHDALWTVGVEEISEPEYVNSWFRLVAGRVALSHWAHKQHLRDTALVTALNIEADDWRAACAEWLERRYAR